MFEEMGTILEEAVEGKQRFSFLYNSPEDKTVSYTMRFLGFEKINPKEVDDFEEVESVEDADYWYLKVEVLNIGQKKIHGFIATSNIVLVDQDECQFEEKTDSHLTYNSEYGRKIGLKRFHTFGEPLLPKIKATGAILFLLPSEEGATFSIKQKEGMMELVP